MILRWIVIFDYFSVYICQKCIFLDWDVPSQSQYYSLCISCYQRGYPQLSPLSAKNMLQMYMLQEFMHNKFITCLRSVFSFLFLISFENQLSTKESFENSQEAIHLSFHIRSISTVSCEKEENLISGLTCNCPKANVRHIKLEPNKIISLYFIILFTAYDGCWDFYNF